MPDASNTCINLAAIAARFSLSLYVGTHTHTDGRALLCGARALTSQAV